MIGDLQILLLLINSFKAAIASFISANCRPSNHLRILPANIVGVYNIYRAAGKVRPTKSHFCEPNHVTGAYRTQQTITPNEPFLPDSFYGASKVFGEAVAKLFFVKAGIEFDRKNRIVFRTAFGSWMMSTWFSPTLPLIKSCSR